VSRIILETTASHLLWLYLTDRAAGIWSILKNGLFSKSSGSGAVHCRAYWNRIRNFCMNTDPSINKQKKLDLQIYMVHFLISRYFFSFFSEKIGSCIGRLNRNFES
jgi:hypothetical protein